MRSRGGTRQLARIVMLVSALCASLAGCGGHGTKPGEAEVRALVAAVTADGRARNFGRICTEEMSGVLRQLDYLVGGNCAKDLAAEWAEGVQLATRGPSSRIVAIGNTAK